MYAPFPGNTHSLPVPRLELSDMWSKESRLLHESLHRRIWEFDLCLRIEVLIEYILGAIIRKSTTSAGI